MGKKPAKKGQQAGRGGRYSEETKSAAMAALIAGQSISEVAKEYEIPVGTVKGWRATASRLNQVEPEKKSAIGDLILLYLQENLETLRAQVKVFRDEDWLKKQSAADAAVLHGVMTDKAVRLLEAMAKSGGSAGAGSGPK